MMTCQELTEKVTAYKDGSLPFGERLGMWMHLLMCKLCTEYVRQFEATVGVLRRLAGREDALGEGPGEDARESLRARFRAMRGAGDSS